MLRLKLKGKKEVVVAARRMISKDVFLSGRFLKLSRDAQVLYTLVILNADDEGVCDGYLPRALLGVDKSVLAELAKAELIAPLDAEQEILYVCDWDKQNKVQGSRLVPSNHSALLKAYKAEPLAAVPPAPPANCRHQAKEKYSSLVAMTSEEYAKLVDKYGEAATSEMIEMLDSYKGSKGVKYKDDYRAILSWVVDKYREKHQKKPLQSQRQGKNNAEAGYRGALELLGVET